MHNWDILEKFNNTSIHFNTVDIPTKGPCWVIEEFLDDELIFSLKRSKLTYQRYTDKDVYGIIGLSEINLHDTRCFLTEGVSDYFTMKLKYPRYNVLGLTTLSGSHDAKQILINLFSRFIICADNDVNSSVNTGMNNAYNLAKLLQSFGKMVKITQPSSGFKDVTDEFVFRWKLNASNP